MSKKQKPAAMQPAPDPIQQQLLERLQQGDETAFAELTAEYSQTIYNIALRMLRNREDAADMTQEVLIKIYRNIALFRGDSQLSTWIYRISVNTCRDALRLAYRRKESVFSGFGEEEEQLEYEVADYSALPEEIYLSGEENQYLYSLIEGLAPAFRLVVVMREFAGLSYQEIADAAQISVGTVKSRISRARAAMREQAMKDAEQYPQLQRLIRKGGQDNGTQG